MDEEEKELQIKLAKLNAKLQIEIASVFGLIALAGAFLVVGYQFGIDSLGSLPTISPKLAVSLLFFVLAILAGVVALDHFRKLKSCEEEINNLK